MKLRMLMLASTLFTQSVFAGSEQGLTYYKDIKPIFDRSCASCHFEGGIAALPLASLDQIKPWASIIRYSVDSGRMPVWLAAPGHQEYKNNLALNDTEKNDIVSWIDAGTPTGDLNDYKPVPPNWQDIVGDVLLEVTPDPYLPDQRTSDDYRCFVVDWPVNEPMAYITANQTRPGNTNIAHHLVSYIAEPNIVQYLKRSESEQERPGYKCFGGALPDAIFKPEYRKKFENEVPGVYPLLETSTQRLSGWTPGKRAVLAPQNSGTLIRKGGAVIVQMHYYTARSKQEPDHGTTLAINYSTESKYPGLSISLSHSDWFSAKNNGSMVIPANTIKEFKVDKSLYDLVAPLFKDPRYKPTMNKVAIHTSNLHMHAYGTSAISTLIYPDGREEVLLDIPNFDIGWQRNYQFMKTKVFSIDEAKVIHQKVSCTFTNNGNLNPDPNGPGLGAPTTVYGGMGSYDEMCINFSIYTLRD